MFSSVLFGSRGSYWLQKILFNLFILNVYMFVCCCSTLLLFCVCINQKNWLILFETLLIGFYNCKLFETHLVIHIETLIYLHLHLEKRDLCIL